MSNTASNHNATMTTTATRTILRIKRRRTEEPLPYIRLEGLSSGTRGGGGGGGKRSRDDDDGEGSSEGLDRGIGEGAESNGNNNRSTTALWKRFDPHQGCGIDEGKQEEGDHYRIVNAMLTEEGEDGSHNQQRMKRRKLTVLETTTSDLPSVISLAINHNNNSLRKQPIRVLDPLSRMVDDSLQEVHIGNKSVVEHYRLIKTDMNLVYESKKWLTWCHSEGGNVLHACALWNDVEMASELLHLVTETSMLTEAVDADGRTPYEVAHLSGHDSVCEILEAFGGDTSNFVYDIFCLDEDTTQTSKTGGDDTNEGGEEDQNWEPTAVELTSGVGYWTPEGELVLEAPEKSPASLTHVFDEDGEIDSNCEEYGGNDYPEDEEDVDWGVADDNDDIDEYANMQARYNVIDMYSREEADYNNDFVHSGYDM